MVLIALLLAASAAAQAPIDPAVLVSRGMMRQAEPLLVARLARSSVDVEALLLLAQVRTKQERLEEALQLAEQAMAAAPNEARTHYRVAEVCGIRAQKVGALKAAGLAKRFKREVDVALALDPRSIDAIEASIEFHQQAPGLVGGDKKKLPLLLDRLTAIEPSKGWARRARVAMLQKDTTSAESHYRRAVAAEVVGNTARLAFARFLAPRFRKPGEAEKLALEVATREPWRQEAWGMAAYLQAAHGRVAEAQATLARAEAADPLRAGAAYMVGGTLLKDGMELAFAEKQVRRYLAHEPEYGWPSLADAHWSLSQILERQGRKPEAITELQAALRLQPDLDYAKKDLKRLRYGR
ncbi:MAG: tetratricopeptide repeat protein [Candidatus Eisenbacteria bacterium]